MSRKKRKLKSGINRRSMLKSSALIMTPFVLGLGSCVNLGKKSYDTEVIVVGAGLSGLNAALLLEENGYSVKIVEATERIGGRVFTAREKDVPGHPELGANGIGGGYARLLNAANKYNVKIGPSRPRTEPRKGKVLYAIKDELIMPDDWPDHTYNPNPEGYRTGSPASPAWSIYSKLNPLPKNDLVAWRQPKYAEWDKSVYDVMKKEGFSDEAIKLGVGTNSSYGVDGKNISILMFFQIMNFIIQQSAFNGKGGAAVGGNQRIPEAMANAFGQDIMLNSPVSSIESEKDGVELVLENGKKMRAQYVLVTLPASALRHVKMSPDPKGVQKEAFENLYYTPCVQFHFVPTRKYWEDDGLPPSMWTDKLSGRFMALQNNPESPDEIISCVAYLNSTMALKASKMDEKEAFAAVMKVLEETRPSLKGALRPVYSWKWSNNKFAGGAYAYWKPGEITKYAKSMANPNGRIHFAGEHTAIVSRGMEGAMESGERAALEIMNIL